MAPLPAPTGGLTGSTIEGESDRHAARTGAARDTTGGTSSEPREGNPETTPIDNLAWLNEQAARNKVRQIGSTEFGADQPQAETYEKGLFDQKSPATIQPGADGALAETIVFRDGADITSTIMGVVPAGTHIHVVAAADLNYVLAEFRSGGSLYRGYIYGAAIKPLGGGP